ncbi:MAG: transcriptional repressor LexA [Deferrisomatales bacterium]
MGRTPAGETRQKVFAFVRERLSAGRPPTVREVQEALGFRAVQTARQHLEALVAEGRLAVDRGLARGYRLPGRHRPAARVPLLGRVPAGPFDTAVEVPEGYLAVEGEAGELFALRVKGESMTGAGILPGDVVVIRRQATARSGEVVVARVGDEATVKRLRLRKGRVELHPENPAFAPLVPEPGAVEILGVVVELRRKL